MSPTETVVPFGEVLICRPPAERLTEEIYSAIPALAKLSTAALTAGNRLGQEARNALFYGNTTDPGLRALKVEIAVERQESMVVPELDLNWLRSAPAQGPLGSSDLHEDAWLKPGME